MIGAKARIVAACVAALAIAAQAFAEKTTVEFANGTTRPKSVALLPVNRSAISMQSTSLTGSKATPARAGTTA